MTAAKKIYIPATKDDHKQSEVDNGGIDHSNTIDLRKSPDYDQYRMVIHFDYNVFIEQCNSLSKLGWVPAFNVFCKGELNNHYAQQWVLRAKKEIKPEIKEPSEVKIIGTVVTRDFFSDEEDF